jgi:endonuclease/exonuclease/phosphatase family metal-dependent hydrolase
LRLASYNIHGAVGTDGRRDLGRIIGVIAEINPDVIALQEVETRASRSAADQAELIACALGMACVEGRVLIDGDGWYGNAILTRKPVREVRRWQFPDHSGERRGALGVVVVDPRGRAWHVVTMHMDLYQRRRVEQAQALARFLAPAPAWPRVVLGDINEWWPWSPTWPILRQLGAVSPGLRSFPSWCPLVPLDRVILQGCVAREPPRCHQTPLSRIASDHLPVVVDLAV